MSGHNNILTKVKTIILESIKYLKIKSQLRENFNNLISNTILKYR